jgi:hypothetical protein
MNEARTDLAGRSNFCLIYTSEIHPTWLRHGSVNGPECLTEIVKKHRLNDFVRWFPQPICHV